jgi:GntR family transcriptional regulator
MNDQSDAAGMNYSQIQRNLDAPLYAQIQRNIEVGIATNKLKPGDTILGEVELASLYGVSRVTVRQALRELVTEGLLYRIQGKGTFVSQPVIQRTDPHITSFFYEMVQSGRKPSAEFTAEICEPDADAIKLLQLEPGELVIVTKRLRFIDGEPIVYQINTTREILCPGLLEEDLSKQSFQYILEIKYGLRISEVDEELTVMKPDEGLAETLDITTDVPVLVDSRILHGTEGTIIGRAQAFFRGDRYTYKVTRNLGSQPFQ